MSRSLLFYHTLAMLHSPAYRVENVGALRQDCPGFPCPKPALLALNESLDGNYRAAIENSIPETG